MAPGSARGQIPAMVPLVRAAVLFMVTALTLYSIGVWGERWTAYLEPWHVALFWLGFVCDTAGTEMMRRLAGGFQLNLHSLTGALALLLMLGHAVWATAVLRRHDERARATFHRVSVLVWCVWLVPFITGAIIGRRLGR